jgi:hypothetical protein
MLFLRTRFCIRGGKPQEPMLANKHLFKCICRIPHQVEPVYYLYSCRRSLAHAICIGSRPITTDNLNAGVLDQPLRERLGAAVG